MARPRSNPASAIVIPVLALAGVGVIAYVALGKSGGTKEKQDGGSGLGTTGPAPVVRARASARTQSRRGGPPVSTTAPAPSPDVPGIAEGDYDPSAGRARAATKRKKQSRQAVACIMLGAPCGTIASRANRKKKSKKEKRVAAAKCMLLGMCW